MSVFEMKVSNVVIVPGCVASLLATARWAEHGSMTQPSISLLWKRTVSVDSGENPFYNIHSKAKIPISAVKSIYIFLLTLRDGTAAKY